jgi:hypothetical protein
MTETENQWWQTDTNDEVATKPELWRPIANAIGGFDLDPAAGCEPTPIADNRYTPADDGLAQPWHGTVWLNPPFSDKTPWYRRVVSQYEMGNIDRAVVIATVDPSADWFHDWFSQADVIAYLDGRDWYLGSGDSPTFSTQVGVWNPTAEVVDVLQSLGTCVEPLESGVDQASLGDYGGDE